MSQHSVAQGCLAVVVTFDAPDRLESTLHCLAAQTVRPERVIVVNNGGRAAVDAAIESTNAALRGQLDVAVVHSPVNDGPAGGHARGMSSALSGGAEWVWVMDDDFAMPPDCLDLLLGAAADGTGPMMVWPRHIAADGVERNYPSWCGLIINRSAVELGGLPRADLVWWVEDTEYLQWRLPRAGVVQRTAPVSVLHGDARPESARPPWKTYYETRNTIWYRWHEQRRDNWVRLVVVLPRLFVAALLSPSRREGVRAFLRGTGDGFRQRLGLRWPLPD